MLSDRHFCDSFKVHNVKVLMSSWLILVSFLCGSRDIQYFHCSVVVCLPVLTSTDFFKKFEYMLFTVTWPSSFRLTPRKSWRFYYYYYYCVLQPVFLLWLQIVNIFWVYILLGLVQQTVWINVCFVTVYFKCLKSWKYVVACNIKQCYWLLFIFHLLFRLL